MTTATSAKHSGKTHTQLLPCGTAQLKVTSVHIKHTKTQVNLCACKFYKQVSSAKNNICILMGILLTIFNTYILLIYSFHVKKYLKVTKWLCAASLRPNLNHIAM